MTIKKILPNLAVLFLSIILSLFIIEMVSRHLGRDYFQENRIYALTDYSVFYPRPNYQFTLRRPEFVTEIKLNSKGLREKEIGYEKPPNTQRILILGDSFIAAKEHSLEKTVSKKLEQLLQQNSKKNMTYQTINMGMGGFGPTPLAVILEKEGIKYQPDIVIFSLFVGNDITKIDFGVSGDIPKELFEKYDSLEDIKFEVTGTQKIKNFIFRNYFTYSYLRKALNDLQAEEPNDPLYPEIPIYFAKYPPSVQKNMEKLRIILRHLRNYANKKKIPLVVVLIPSKEQVDKGLFLSLAKKYHLNEGDANASKAQKMLMDIGREENITMLDMLPEFSKRNKNNTFYFQTDAHWNEMGHELAANLIHEKLIREKLVS